MTLPVDLGKKSSAMDNMPTLHIRLLGEFSLIHGSEAVRSVSTLRLQSLLAHLVLHRRAPESRRHLAFTLWTDSSESQARTNLRRELHHLRQALPEADRFLAVEMQSIQWRPDASFTLDVADFEQAVTTANQAETAANELKRRAALEQAVALYKGDLLPGCYDEWLLTERERLRQAYLQALEQLIPLLQKHRDYRSAIGYAQQLLREDPLAEEACLFLIQLYTLTGDRSKALRVYHTCVSTMQRELGVEPGPAMRQAHRQLLKATPSQTLKPASQTTLISSSPLVGRQAQWQQLLDCWHQADGGRSRFVVVAGEAGIGKTRLVEEWVDWAARQEILTAQARCYASQGGLAYAPVAHWLRTTGLRQQLLRLEDVWLTQIARLLPELLSERSDLPPPEPMTERWQQQSFFEALARAILIDARPLVLVIDDLQWTDQETLTWLHYLLRYNCSSPLLVAGTMRSTEVDASQPLTAWLMDLSRTDQLTQIELKPLNEPDTIMLATHLAGNPLDAMAARRLYAETEGHPLFIVETVRAGELKETFGDRPLLPPKIQAVIESRLAQLSSPARRLANLAAAIGRSFTFEVLAQASRENEDTLVSGLDELWQRRIIREQSENDYDFSHDKIREVVYNHLSAANRRLVHRRIAEAMETVHAADLDPVSKQLARQYEAAGNKEKAIACYLRAGQTAQRIYANTDAIQLYAKALTLLETLPDSLERAEQERLLQRLLSIAQRNVKGYAAAEVGQALTRALELCRQLQLDQAEALAPILWGLFTFNIVRSDLQRARQLGEELFALAQKHENPIFREQAHHALGGTLCNLGEFEASLKHFDQGIALYDPDQHRAQAAMFGMDLGVFCQAWSSHAMWHLGFADQSLNRCQAAVALAKSLNHPFSLALAMAYAAMLCQFNRNSQQVRQWAQATIDFCAHNGVGYYDSWATILHGWAMVEQGLATQGIDQMLKGLTAFRASKAEIRLPYYLTLLAEAYANVGKIREGRKHLDEALHFAQKNNDNWYNAETHRLMGDLLLRSDQAQEAQACYQKSLAISRSQQARTLELRATVSLTRLQRAQNRQEKNRDMLKNIVDSFSEGFDTVDLKLAAKLVDELS